MPRSLRTRARLLSIPAYAALLLCGGGCDLFRYSEGGPGYSADQHVYKSEPYRPWTVTLKDTRTGQDLWSCEVPIGHKLAIKFSQGAGPKDSETPDLMYWEVLPPGHDHGELSNSIPVPPSYARRLDPTLRPVPEFATAKAEPKTNSPLMIITEPPPQAPPPAQPSEPAPAPSAPENSPAIELVPAQPSNPPPEPKP